jgi:hypothetical protein
MARARISGTLGKPSPRLAAPRCSSSSTSPRMRTLQVAASAPSRLLATRSHSCHVASRGGPRTRPARGPSSACSSRLRRSGRLRPVLWTAVQKQKGLRNARCPGVAARAPPQVSLPSSLGFRMPACRRRPLISHSSSPGSSSSGSEPSPRSKTPSHPNLNGVGATCCRSPGGNGVRQAVPAGSGRCRPCH